jgi:hypothetical protein
MSDEKYCQNCGAKNQPYAAICAECGSSFIEPTASPPTPPPLILPEEQPSEKPLPAAPPEPPRRFKKRYILYGVLIVLSLLVIAGAISASQQIASRSNATPTFEASAIASSPSPEVLTSVSETARASVSATTAPGASATPSPAQSSLPDYASRLNTVGLGAGLYTASPFQQVTLNGKQAYAGTLIKNGQTYNAQVYPMSSYSETLAFKDQLINAYKSHGYATYNPGSVGDANLSIWYGLSGNTLVSVSAMPTSQIDAPVVLVMTATT